MSATKWRAFEGKTRLSGTRIIIYTKRCNITESKLDLKQRPLCILNHNMLPLVHL